MLTTKEAIALKIETTQGVEAAPDPSADAILVSELSYANEGLRMVERPLIKPTISTEQSIFAGTLKKLTFTAELKGSGTAGVAPEIGQALRCCGMSETIGSSVVYQPVSEGHESCTIYYYQDGRLNKIVGAKGTATINAEAGGLGTIQFEFTGKDAGRVDQNFPALSYNATVPRPFIEVPFSIGGYDAIINSFSLAFGNTISTPGNVREADGYAQVEISKRDPNGSIDPEAQKISVIDFETKFKNGELMDMTTGDVGKVAGNIWNVSAKVGIRDISSGERDQRRTDDLTYGAHETLGDDEFTIEFK
ncbi:phage tail tube protein [Alteromonas sp. DY56-G5]|uniref:phage tail tube protein n=1 Tax=Alteromonas sp. DY56-G5 TaxID=2967128 RepID=UPI00352A3053